MERRGRVAALLSEPAGRPGRRRRCASGGNVDPASILRGPLRGYRDRRLDSSARFRKSICHGHRTRHPVRPRVRDDAAPARRPGMLDSLPREARRRCNEDRRRVHLIELLIVVAIIGSSPPSPCRSDERPAARQADEDGRRHQVDRERSRTTRRHNVYPKGLTNATPRGGRFVSPLYLRKSRRPTAGTTRAHRDLRHGTLTPHQLRPRRPAGP